MYIVACTQWLRECELEHPRCRKGLTISPSRVLDVGSSKAIKYASLYLRSSVNARILRLATVGEGQWRAEQLSRIMLRG
jgi:hypothetical protein